MAKGGRGGFAEQLGLHELMLQYDKELKLFGQQLRRNTTEAEKLLWRRLRGKQLKGYQFYQQKIIGCYIVDFYCPKASLVIELDGGQHYGEAEMIKDEHRDEILNKTGLRVLRFSNREVFENIDAVMEKIWSNL